MDTLFASPLGPLILNRWVDSAFGPWLTDHYLPMAAGWAAAVEADGDVDRFRATFPNRDDPKRQVQGAVAAVAARAREWRAAEGAWRDRLFGAGFGAGEDDDAACTPGGAPARAEADRVRTASRFFASRSAMMRLHWRRRFPIARWPIHDTAMVEARHGARRTAASWPVPQPSILDSVQVSRPVPYQGGRCYWVRFPSRVGDIEDTCWARVIEPPQLAETAPVTVVAQGIAIETEFQKGFTEPPWCFTRRGMVTIRPEGPFHGRRRLPGCYGGEPLLAGDPLALLDFMESFVAELGTLIAWARARYGGSVGLAGISLGALASQLVALAATDWPDAYTPDALALLTTSASMIAVAHDGSLAKGAHVSERLTEAGWTRGALTRWRRILEPRGLPAVDPAKIIMLLGAFDTVTPFDQGQTLAVQWEVPDANVFVRPLGHFTTALSVLRDDTPLLRFADALGAPEPPPRPRRTAGPHRPRRGRRAAKQDARTKATAGQPLAAADAGESGAE